MNVLLIYRNYKNLHSIHQSMVNNPPEDIGYIIPKTKKTLKKFYPIYYKFRDTKFFIYTIRKLKRFLFTESSNEKESDLIHYIQYVPENLKINKPYVVDFEHVMGFTDFLVDEVFFENNVRVFLENKNCKKIIAMSEAAKKTLRLAYGKNFNKIQKKVVVIYPTLPITEGKQSFNDKFKFLFVGNQVYRKGLHEVLEAFVRLPNEKTELVVISDIPQSLKDKFNRKNIKYYKPMFSYNEILEDFFCKADMFVMPTHSDTYGMVYMDAMSCGLPVIATNHFAIPELVVDGKTGFVLKTNKQYLSDKSVVPKEMGVELKILEKKLVNTLYETMEYCIENRKVVKEMGLNAQRLFDVGGKFSIDKRNKLLKEAYEESLEVY